MVETPLRISMGKTRVFTIPKATVPSWQLRQSLDEPLGWPIVALAVELL
jgi:hypothetical protein